MGYPLSFRATIAIAAVTLLLAWGVALADHKTLRNQNFDEALLFVMEGVTTLNQFGLPATAPAGDFLQGPSLVTTRYDLVQDFWTAVVGMSSSEVASFEEEMQAFMFAEWGLTVLGFDAATGVAPVLDSAGLPVAVAFRQYVKPEMNYRPYWIQGIPKRRLKRATVYDIGFVVSLLQDTVANGAQSGLALTAGSAIAYGRYLIRGIRGRNDALITFFSTRPILPTSTHLECELISDEFGEGQALLVNPAILAEEIDPATHATRFLTRNVLTFPRRLNLRP